MGNQGTYESLVQNVMKSIVYTASTIPVLRQEFNYFVSIITVRYIYVVKEVFVDRSTAYVAMQRGLYSGCGSLGSYYSDSFITSLFSEISKEIYSTIPTILQGNTGVVILRACNGAASQGAADIAQLRTDIDEDTLVEQNKKDYYV